MAKETEKKEKKPRVARKKTAVKQTPPALPAPEPAIPKISSETSSPEEGGKQAWPEETSGAEESERYWEATGRRKTAVARVRLFTRGEKGIWVNDKLCRVYFPYPRDQGVIKDPLEKMKSADRFRVTIKVSGGGVHSQAEAARHGISRALVEFNADFRKRLKRAGFLTRDPRMKERKKFGLKGARRAPQWAKR